MATFTDPSVDGSRSMTAARDRAWLAAGGVAVAVGLAQLADLVTFLRLMAVHGTAAEANALAAAGMGLFGPVPLIVAKVALIVLISAGFVIVAPRRARLSVAIASAGMVAGLLGAYSNILAL
jgi:hypothetical protein